MALSPWHGSQREGLSLSLEVGEPGIGGHLRGESATNYTACLPWALPATLSSFRTCGHYAWPPWGAVESRSLESPPPPPCFYGAKKLIHGWVPSPPLPTQTPSCVGLGRESPPDQDGPLLPVGAPGSPLPMADSARAPETPGVPGAPPIRHGVSPAHLTGWLSK